VSVVHWNWSSNSSFTPILLHVNASCASVWDNPCGVYFGTSCPAHAAYKRNKRNKQSAPHPQHKARFTCCGSETYDGLVVHEVDSTKVGEPRLNVESPAPSPVKCGLREHFVNQPQQPLVLLQHTVNVVAAAIESMVSTKVRTQHCSPHQAYQYSRTRRKSSLSARASSG